MLIMKLGNKLLRSLISKLSIDPSKALHSHLIFWLPIVFFGALSIAAGLSTSRFNLEYLSKPKQTMDALAYPVFLLSFALPIVVAVGRFHASSQRAETIRISQSTMSFKHYFDHRQAFLDYLEGYKQRFRWFEIEITQPIKIYELFFPKAKMDSFQIEPCEETITELKQKLESLFQRLNKTASPDMLYWFDGTLEIFNGFGIKIIYQLDEIYNDVDSLSGHNAIVQPLKELELILYFADEFDRNYNHLNGEARVLLKRYLAAERQYEVFNTALCNSLDALREGAEMSPEIKTL